ncbi:hypothetical protein [Arcanobacterium buesumense]|nr:hypothetical protein [Arcanobacterium buesumense]
MNPLIQAGRIIAAVPNSSQVNCWEVLVIDYVVYLPECGGAVSV